MILITTKKQERAPHAAERGLAAAVKSHVKLHPVKNESMMKEDFRYVFGPVPSRRLGRSLGVDLVPFKTCSFDCIYCQLGRTTNKTVSRNEYVPFRKVLTEIDRKLQKGISIDYITLSGSGEPTLYSKLYPLIQNIKDKVTTPLAVLTNSSLLFNKDVQQALTHADLVIPSLDVADASTFRYVNRPHPDISFDRMIEGLVSFRNSYSKQLWLEILLILGVTGVPAYVEKLDSYVQKIKPDRIQLNTVTRPPSEDFAFRVPQDKMHKLAAMFGGNAEVIADFSHLHYQKTFSFTRQEVSSLLRRRPCSLDDISMGLGIHRNEAVKHLEELLKKGIVTTEVRNGKLFYKMKYRKKSTGTRTSI